MFDKLGFVPACKVTHFFAENNKKVKIMVLKSMHWGLLCVLLS